MSGKRERGEALKVRSSPANHLRTSLTDATRNDRNEYCGPVQTLELGSRWFVPIRIGEITVSALVDTGSSVTLLGEKGRQVAAYLGRDIVESPSRHIILANGDIERSVGSVTLPFQIAGVTRELSVRIVPAIMGDAILGLDGIRAFEMSFDSRTETWRLGEDAQIEHRFWGSADCSAAVTVTPEGSGIAELSDTEISRLDELLEREIREVPEGTGMTDLAVHTIDVGDNVPIKQRYYMVSPKVREAINDEVDRMLAEGIIEPSSSAWSSPIVMVRKPNGKYRFCVDYRKVNSVTRRDAYPVPYMDGILDRLRSAQYISTIDLSHAYHQVPMEEKSKPMTAFTVPGRGLYQFRRMPYGLTNAPATFQRLIDRLIGPELEPHAFAYLDDIIVVTETFDEHLEWLQKVLRRVSDAKLAINREKCEFCCAQVKYLGFVVNRTGLQIDDE